MDESPLPQRSPEPPSSPPADLDEVETSVPVSEDQAGEAAVDLSALETIELELQAVEEALVQIDEGVYEGFAGLPSS